MDSAEQEVSAEEVHEQSAEGQTAEEVREQTAVDDQPVTAESEQAAEGERTAENEEAGANKEQETGETSAGDKPETAGEPADGEADVAEEGVINEPEAAVQPADDAGETDAGTGDGAMETGTEPAGTAAEVSQEDVGDVPEASQENANEVPEESQENAGEVPEASQENADEVPEASQENANEVPEASQENADDAPEVAGENAAEEPEAVEEDHDQPAEGASAEQLETQDEGGPQKAEDPEQGEKVGQAGDEKQEPAPEMGEQAVERAAEEADAKVKQEQGSPRMEEKGTPEPSTEHMATGTDQPGEGLGPAGRPVAEHHAAPSPVPHYDADATATVKFVLLPTQQVATLRCYLTQTLYELKEHFAQELKIPASSILFMLDGKGTKDGMTLAELGVGPNGTIRLEMQSADPENQPIKAFKPRQEYTMPDVISVRVSSEGGMKDVVVEIERANSKKPFLGGYRHKKTGVEYHHASAQTIQKPRPPPPVERFCRDTQTVKQRHALQQTTNDMATQMTKIGVYVTNMQDKVIIPGKYLTADEFKMNTLEKVIVIQKYYRRWLAKRYVEKIRNDQARRLEWERKEDLRKKKEKEDRIRREFERRMNPKTKEDFDLLYHALEKWRQEEMNHINETLTGAERKAALCQLLDQETQLISSIGRHKLDASNENRQKAIQAFLEKASSPKKWKGPDGKQTEMDTPYTIRAQELRDIYNSINMKYLTQDERLDVLLTLKHTVKEHDCKLTQEIIELIDREADLLMRGVKESNLEGLRRRISSLFLQYIKTPTFNPEAARLLKVPQDPSTLRNNIYFCPSCNQYLPSTEFQLSSNSRTVGKCRKCNKIDNDARVRQDYSHYRYMLKSIRKAEESYDDDSKIAFLIQENDLRYLVENIWNSQSVLSAWDDLYDLVLVRWDRHQEWSPWNSILLTKEEATAHKKLERLEEAYGKVFLHKVKHKHTLARNYFSRMPGMAEHMRSRNSSALPSGPAISGKAITPAKA